jgi:hypothetical protein
MANLDRSSTGLAFILFVMSVFAGCGGGNSAGGGGNPPPPPPASPTLTSIVPSSVMAGASGITIQANGTNFANRPTIQWNGSSLLTTFVSSTQLTAVVPANDLANVGTAQLTVSNNEPGASGSGALTFTIAAAQAPSAWVRALNYSPKDIAWDPVRGNLIASLGSDDAVSPNTLLVIDPISGSVQTALPTGHGPHLLSFSSDASYLWVGLDDDSAVQRYTLPDLQKDILIPLPPDSRLGSQQAVSLESARKSPHSLAVGAGNWGTSPPGWNIYVYDDSVKRNNSISILSAGLPFIDWLQWGKDDSILYGTQRTTIDSPGGVVSMGVSASGVSKKPGDGGFPGGTGQYSYFSPATGLMYSYLEVADPAQLANVGDYNLLGDMWQCVPDANVGRYYCLVEPQQYGPGAELWVFDLTKYNLLARIDLSRVVTGGFARLIRWGNAGLALISFTDMYGGNGGLFLIDGPAINPNVTPDTTLGTATTVYPLMLSLQPESAPEGSPDVRVTVTGQNFTPNSVACWPCSNIAPQLIPTSYISPSRLDISLPVEALRAAGPIFIGIYDSVRNTLATNSLTFTVSSVSNSNPQVVAMNLDGLATAWDKTASLLYVATGGLDRAYPSSIVAVDPATATVKNSVQVSPFPYFITISAQDQFLYLGFGEASLETQLALPGLNPVLTWPLSNPAYQNDTGYGNQFYAGDLEAAPQDPHTTAVTLFNYSFSPPAIGGVAIFDDNIQRENIVPGWGGAGNDVDVLAWGGADSVLMGSSNDQSFQTDYLFTVDPSGVSLRQSIFSNFNAPGYNIHSDFGTGLVYSDTGNVADPSTDQIVGSINASGLVVPDSSLNRIFVLGQTQQQQNTDNYTIASFDQTTYGPVSTITVQHLLGAPISMGRCADHCLAVATFNPNWSNFDGPVGMLYLITDPTFVNGTVQSGGIITPANGDLALRWKRPSRTEIVGRQRTRSKSQTCWPAGPTHAHRNCKPME